MAIRGVALVLAVCALIAGLIAARRWYQSAAVEIDLGYSLPGEGGGTFKRMGLTLPRFMEPVDPTARSMNETSATWDALQQSARLSKVAALWTAASVVLSALSAVAGALG